VVGDQGGEGEAAEVGQGVLVVAGGDAAPVFEPVEAALDGVAVPVGLGVEAGWSSTAGALGLTALDLVAALGDGVRDLQPAQVAAGRGM
jgi:hypothetical protein